MPTRRYVQVDVFAPRAGAGNPLAVVYDAQGMEAPAMQAFAAWTNLSETVFFLPPSDGGADYAIRIFTPRMELPFAGHPSVGAAWAALDAGLVRERDGPLVQECAAGLLPVRIRRQGDRLLPAVRSPAARPVDAPAPGWLAGDRVWGAARGALPNTELSDASVSMGGYPVALADTRDYYQSDIRYIVVVTVIVVLIILMLLLRALIAPLYLVGSVVISYFAALGLGVLLFQVILDQQLHWSVPPLAFVVLVAVGADYNLLLVSRMRDEAPAGRFGIIRTLSSTGGVITAAGLIFAASMWGLLFSSIGTVVQGGFVIGIGILLDTFLVRTVTVPAMATLVGRANWWPSRLTARGSGNA